MKHFTVPALAGIFLTIGQRRHCFISAAAILMANMIIVPAPQPYLPLHFVKGTKEKSKASLRKGSETLLMGYVGESGSIVCIQLI